MHLDLFYFYYLVRSPNFRKSPKLHVLKIRFIMLLLFDTLCNFNNFMHIYNLFSGNQTTSFFFSNCKASFSSESADVIKFKKYDFNIIEHLKLVSKCYSWCCVNCQNINSFCLICYHLTDGIHVQASKRP